MPRSLTRGAGRMQRIHGRRQKAFLTRDHRNNLYNTKRKTLIVNQQNGHLTTLKTYEGRHAFCMI